MAVKLLVVSLVVLVSLFLCRGEDVDCEAPDAKESCMGQKETHTEEDCKLCEKNDWKNVKKDEGDSPATPASAPGWMDDNDDGGYQPRGRYQNNYGRHHPQRYGGYTDYGNSNGYSNGGYGNNGYGNNGYGNSYGGGYGNGYGNDGYSNGGYNGYGNDYGYNQMSSNINYGPPVHRYNMGYSNGYNKK
ncbi:hypothetical protein HDE_09297 [Halotydeus destructor]|nr:hypothetical protein HDE_09297 [Halotydeus destructor]